MHQEHSRQRDRQHQATAGVDTQDQEKQQGRGDRVQDDIVEMKNGGRPRLIRSGDSKCPRDDHVDPVRDETKRAKCNSNLIDS